MIIKVILIIMIMMTEMVGESTESEAHLIQSTIIVGMTVVVTLVDDDHDVSNDHEDERKQTSIFNIVSAFQLETDSY